MGARATIGGVAMVLAAGAAGAGRADSLQDIFGRQIRAQGDGVLAVLSMTAVPGETTSALVLDTGTDSQERFDFEQAQLGGGFRVSEGFPLYLEGYLGYNRYDPNVILQENGTPRKLPLKWTSVAATGGIGPEFDLTEYWKFRPLVHLSVGRVQSDMSIAAQVVANRLGIDADFVEGGGITAGGYGASAALVYNHRWESDWEADMVLRYTDLHFEPIGRDDELVASADARATALWSRLRVPTGARLFDRPVRSVYEFSAASFSGDQANVLGTDWLVQVGVGGEIDLETTWVPWVTTTRLVARITVGEELTGFSVGLAASF